MSEARGRIVAFLGDQLEGHRLEGGGVKQEVKEQTLEEEVKEEEGDTLIFPTVQAGQLGVRQDSEVRRQNIIHDRQHHHHQHHQQHQLHHARDERGILLTVSITVIPLHF